jgi:D-alanine-D-alanine ligase
LHGRGGEDGSLQGALEWMRIPYTGSGVMASAISMDKWRTKLAWLSAGLPTPPFRILNADTDWKAVVDELGLPIFVKPVREGSSVGASKVASVEGLSAAYELAVQHDPLVIAESFISGQELTVPFLGDKPLPIVRIVAPGGNYDYQNKYFTDETQYFCPSGLNADVEARVQAIVMQAARILGCRGWGRADLILRNDGGAFLLEMNTSPGMTGHSLVPMAGRAAGLDFPTLCLAILEMASLD